MTTQQQIETRALRVVDRVVKSLPSEDDLVECKAEWPKDHRKAARQIAALCNAAHGENTMWLIGPNERDSSVAEVDTTELANWWPKVEKYFGDKISPDLRNMVVPTAYGTVVALNFGTERAPFLVSTDGTGGVEFEVPYRSGNRTRSAKRHELMLLLSEQADAPDVELVKCQIAATRHSDAAVADPGKVFPTFTSLSSDISVYFNAFIFVHSLKPTTITHHRSRITARFPGMRRPWTFQLQVPEGNGIRRLSGGYHLEVPAGCVIEESTSITRKETDTFKEIDTIRIEIEVHAAGRNRPVLVHGELARTAGPSSASIYGTETLGTWSWQDDNPH